MVVLVLLAGCGRIAFDARSDASSDGAGPDAARASPRTITAGGNKSCALATDGTTYCWGINEGGGLGDGTQVPQRNVPGPIASTIRFDALETGDGGACGLVADGTVYCWGRNTYGQLGSGADVDLLVPTQVTATDAVQVAIGFNATCVRRRDARVACAGRGDVVGSGNTAASHTFTDVPGITDAIDVTSGEEHVCVLVADGSVRCWGQNNDGQLGDGTQGIERLMPTAGPVGPYDDIEAGDYHTCARRLDGTIDCWGRGTLGQLGDGLAATSPTPVRVTGIDDARALALGADHSCALRSGSVATCWGAGSEGTLGDGMTAMVRAAPSANVTLANIAELSTRTARHACARTLDGTVYCWGFNLYGQIGDATDNNLRPDPTNVSVP